MPSTTDICLSSPPCSSFCRRSFHSGYIGTRGDREHHELYLWARSLSRRPDLQSIRPEKLYLLCFLGSAIASILVAVSPSLTLFAAGLALLGVFSSVYHPMSNVLISAKVEQYGRALGIHGAAGQYRSSRGSIYGRTRSPLTWDGAMLTCGLPSQESASPSIALFVDMSPSEAR